MVAAIVLCLMAIAATAEKYLPGEVYQEQCGVNGLTVSCGSYRSTRPD